MEKLGIEYKLVPGIYGIVNKIDGKIYIGSAVSLYDRCEV
jgi:hypothetical protein